MGTSKEGENKHMAWGKEFENDAVAAYECETGRFVEPTGFWVHPIHKWLGASPDGVVGHDGLVEVKCPGKLPEAVPINYRVQMIVQLAVTGRKWCDYYAWTHDGTFLRRVYPAGTEGLIRKLMAFYEEFVLTGVEPPRKKRGKKRG